MEIPYGLVVRQQRTQQSLSAMFMPTSTHLTTNVSHTYSDIVTGLLREPQSAQFRMLRMQRPLGSISATMTKVMRQWQRQAYWWGRVLT